MAIVSDSCVEVNSLVSVENVKTEDNSEDDITIKFEPLEPHEDYVASELGPSFADAPEVAKNGKLTLEGCDAGLSGKKSFSNEEIQVGSSIFCAGDPYFLANSLGALKKEPMMMSDISTPRSVSQLTVRSDFDLENVVKNCEVRLVRCKLVESILLDQFGTRHYFTDDNILHGDKKNICQRNSHTPPCFKENEARGNKSITEEKPANSTGHLKLDTKRDKKLACDHCSYKARWKVNLIRHLVIHQESRDKPFGCDHCDFRTDQKKSLVVHLRTHQSSRDKPFACSHCEYRTDCKANFRVHLRTHQSNRDKPFACSHCEYRTDHKPNLQRHLRTHQTDRNKPFTCSHCKYRTDYKRNLQLHLRTHQSDRNKPFACDHCEYKTGRRIALHVHQRTHQNNRVKPFACSQCNYKTHIKTCLRVHLRTHQIE